MHLGETFWVGVALFLFIGVLIYYKVPRKISAALDKRSAEIARQLEEARKLRDEAQEVLASYKRQQQESEQQAADIVAQAKSEAEQAAVRAKADLDAALERRRVLAEQRISQAEAQAVKQVRDAAIEIAIQATRKIVEEHLDEAQADQLIKQSIANLNKRLH